MTSKESQPFRPRPKLYCVNCNTQFYFRDFTPRGSRCPVLLQCGHSACESCTQQSIRDRRNIVCRECNFVSVYKPPGNNTTNSFPSSLYVLGNLVAFHNQKYAKEKKLEFWAKNSGNFNYSYKAHPISDSQAIGKSDCEECFREANWFCENCRSNYCDFCWSKVHSSAKSLMRHCKTSITTVQKSGIMKCPLHETQDLEFFCRSCSTAICSHCIILQHQGEGHYPVTLKEKNMEILNKVKSSAEDAELVKKRMKQTLDRIRLMQISLDSTEKKMISDMESQIMKNFARIHGILQLEEHRILQRLYEKAFIREGNLRLMGKQLEEQIGRVETLLGEYEWAMKKPQCSDLTRLEGQLENVLNLPCYLISKKTEESVEPMLAFDDSFVESLQKYCVVDVPFSEDYELRSSNDLPQDYAVEPLNQPPFEAPRGSQESLNISDFDSVSCCSSQDFTNNQRTRDAYVFREKRNYSVYVSYIKNPGEFYILPTSEASFREAMMSRIAHLASNSVELPTKVAKDEIYLVKRTWEKKWYRGRVVGKSQEAGSEENVVVHFLDYGFTEPVHLSRMRICPSDVEEEAPMAVRCKLFDCVPKNGTWCDTSTKTMAEIVQKNMATMFVMKVYSDILEVDLSVVYPEEQIGRDILSVRDSLLFLELSAFVNGPKIPLKLSELMYLHQYLPAPGESFDAIITHINSPSDFYVQRARQDSSSMYKMTLDMQKYYEANLHKGMIYNPVKDMPCAALYSTDEKWYRAKILDIKGKKMVTVFYVDFGNVETIPWTWIRKLREVFFNRPPLALSCSLAGIRSAEEEWSSQAKAHMNKCIHTQNCRIQIHSKREPQQKLKVLLFKAVKDRDICVNSLFVDLGYAKKLNSRATLKSELVEDEVLMPALEPPPEMKENVELAMQQSMSEKENVELAMQQSMPEKETVEKRKSFNKSKLSAKKLREHYERQKKTLNRQSSEEEVVENTAGDQTFKVKVEVLSCESPSCIYVTFPALQTDFNKLQQELNEFYQNSSASEVSEWVEGNICVAYHSLQSSWYRASVLSVLPDGQIKVFLKDIAKEATVPASDLRQLDSSFMKYASCSVKCHLADIGPAGEQWPSISSEYLINELESYKEVYMTKKGQIENKSLPIELWVKKIVPGGALEPTGMEWVTLNKLLVNQGLAIPKIIKTWFAGALSNGDDSDEVSVAKKLRSDAVKEEMKNENETESLEQTLEDMDVFMGPSTPQWPPPEPLKKTQFSGVTTFVDSDANLYIHDLEDSDKLQEMCATLMKMYEDSKPPPESHRWQTGEACIAKFHLDSCWYRGLVQKVNADMTCKVLFVDYGNVEMCQPFDLRQTTNMEDVPIISHKFRLLGLTPISKDGEWPNSVIEIIHSLLVDKKCEVTVLKPPENSSDVYVASITLDDQKEDFCSFLVDQGLAAVASDDLSNSDSDMSISEDSKNCNEPATKTEVN